MVIKVPDWLNIQKWDINTYSPPIFSNRIDESHGDWDPSVFGQSVFMTIYETDFKTCNSTETTTNQENFIYNLDYQFLPNNLIKNKTFNIYIYLIHHSGKTSLKLI